MELWSLLSWLSVLGWDLGWKSWSFVFTEEASKSQQRAGCEQAQSSALWDHLPISLLPGCLPKASGHSGLPPQRRLSLPLTWLFITMGFCKAPVNHLHSEPKTRQGRRMQLKGSSARLGFPSRQRSPKITSSGSIHSQQKGLLSPDPVAFAGTKDLAFWSRMKLQGLALAQPGHRAGHSSRAWEGVRGELSFPSWDGSPVCAEEWKEVQLSSCTCAGLI